MQSIEAMSATSFGDENGLKVSIQKSRGSGREKSDQNKPKHVFHISLTSISYRRRYNYYSILFTINNNQSTSVSNYYTPIFTSDVCKSRY